MKKHIEIIPVKVHSKEWHRYRLSGIGSSEVAVVLNQHPHYSSIRLFHQKVGDIEIPRFTNELMFHGIYDEKKTSDLWRYYDGTQQGFMENYQKDNIIRKCKKVNGYVRNNKYPWMYSSPDRLMNVKGGFSLITGKRIKSECPLELKDLSSWEAQKWEDEIPRYFICQVTQQMIVLESEYAEIAILRDGRQFYVEPVTYDKVLADEIIEKSRVFWYDRVVPGQKAASLLNKGYEIEDGAMVEEAQAIIASLEPDMDDTLDYEEFMKESFLMEEDYVIGDDNTYDAARVYEYCNGIISLLKDKQQLPKNELLKYLRDNKAEMIDFSGLGKVTFKENKNGTRTFRVGIKNKPDKQTLGKEVNLLSFKY